MLAIIAAQFYQLKNWNLNCYQLGKGESLVYLYDGIQLSLSIYWRLVLGPLADTKFWMFKSLIENIADIPHQHGWIHGWDTWRCLGPTELLNEKLLITHHRWISKKNGAKEVKHKTAHDVTVWLYVCIYIRSWKIGESYLWLKNSNICGDQNQ